MVFMTWANVRPQFRLALVATDIAPVTVAVSSIDNDAPLGTWRKLVVLIFAWNEPSRRSDGLNVTVPDAAPPQPASTESRWAPFAPASAASQRRW